jgi:hypothetical protein
LSVFDVNCRSEVKTAVVFIRSVYRAGLTALATTGTFRRIDVTWKIYECGSKMSWRAFNRFNLSVGNDLDI